MARTDVDGSQAIAPGGPRAVLDRPTSEREEIAERIGRRLDPAMTALGVIFLLVVLGETLASPGTALARAFWIAGWVIWALFVLEFGVRLVIAPSAAAFLKRNWWQVLFLVLPFLRFLRLIQTIRLTRAGRVLGSAARAGRTAGRELTSRVGWLAALTAITILASSQLLYELGEFRFYGEALHAAAIATVTGEPAGATTAVGRVIEFVLAVYSIVVFAALAGMLGAFFLRRVPGRDRDAEGPEGDAVWPSAGGG